jgi:hypothetical protein
MNGALSYQSKVNIDEFFGIYFPPEQCTIENMKGFAPKSHFANIGNGGFVGSTIKHLFESAVTLDQRDFWTRSVGCTFFNTYNMDRDYEVPRIAGSSIQSLFPSDESIPTAVYDPAKGLPFPILIVGANVGGPDVFNSIEFSPLYYGIPVIGDRYLNGKNPGDPDRKIESVGGCLMEPLAFTAMIDKSYAEQIHKVCQEKRSKTAGIQFNDQENVITAKFAKPRRLISVSEQAGMSSNSIAQGLSKVVQSLPPNAFDFPYIHYWSPVTRSSTYLKCCDGGSVDNCALISLLRRKVERIAAFLANNFPVTKDIHTKQVVPLTGFSGFFGRAVVQDGLETDQETFNKFRQVFPANQWDVLLENFRAKARNGETVSHLMTLDVLDNPYCGVFGGWKVKVLFTISHDSTQWNDLLPEDMKKLMKESKASKNFVEENLKILGEEADLDTFPYIPIQNLNYSPMLTNCLAQLASWNVFSNQDNFTTLLMD